MVQTHRKFHLQFKKMSLLLEHKCVVNIQKEKKRKDYLKKNYA